jgi:zinc protease
MELIGLALVLAVVAAACTGSPTRSDQADTTASTVAEDPVIGADGGEIPAPVVDPTPIEPSSEVRIGTLDNGLTYYARSNQAPGAGMSLRLVVNAGSLQQEEPESGEAHFLEHMMFNGTERYPGNELNRVLQSFGSVIGPDLNAYTSYDETVYSLELTDINPDLLDTGFSVLVDWASAATIDEADTIEERGVVREEVRLRDEGSAGVISTLFDEVYFDGTAYDRREPGGDGAMVLEIDADQLRRFYDRWYRPDLMAVVAVGDLPVDRIEELVRSHFSDLESRGSEAPERVEPTVEPIDEPVTRVLTHPEVAAPFGSIDYSITTWDQGTVGGERLTLIQDLYTLMIQNRLLDAVDRAEVELDEPVATRFQENRHQSFLGFNFDAPDLAQGTEYVLSEMRRVELTGFTEEEYQRAADQARTGLDQYLAMAPSTNDYAHADAYVVHFLESAQISSADDTHARLTAIIDDLTAEEISQVFRWEMAQAAPLVVVIGSDPTLVPTEAELQAAVDAAATVTGDQGPSDVPTIEKLMDRPDPVAPLATSEIRELNATERTYDNGVTLRFVYSDIAANEVELRAVGQGGWSALTPEDALIAPAAVDAVSRSGVGDHDRLTYRRFLADASTSLSPYIDETSEGFVGRSASEDLEILFQQLHLSMTAPRVEATALRQTLDDIAEDRRLVETDTWTASQAALADVLYDGDPRFAVAPSDLSDLTEAEAVDVYQQRLGGVDDLVVAIVGDFERETIEELADAYLGTLPARSPDTWTDARPALITDAARRDLVVGSGEATGAVSVLYPSELRVDATTQIELMVLEQILDARLFDELRERLGATYGGFVTATPRWAPTEGVELLLFANVDPTRVEEVLTVMVTETKDLAANGPTPEELERARSVLQADFLLIGNPQLIDMLLTEQSNQPLTYKRRNDLLPEVSTTDVQSLAARVMPADVRIEVIALPADG